MEKLPIFNMTRFSWLIILNIVLTVFILFINNKLNLGSVSPLIVNECYPASSLSKSSSDLCKWRFHHYYSSPWESYWYHNISFLQDVICPTLVQEDQTNKSITTLLYIKRLQKAIYHHSSPSNLHDSLFSKMYYRHECAGSNDSSPFVSQYIEPLVGLLRDPLQICSYGGRSQGLTLEGAEALQSKNFILLGPSAPYQNFRTAIKSTTRIAPWLYVEGAQKILFDLGSSYFNGVDEKSDLGSSHDIRWFYEYFHQFSLQFDRVIAFESDEYSPATYWDQIPDDFVSRLTLINRAVENTGKFNPWNILKSIATKDDYVLVKLDLNQTALENELIDQLLNDTSILSLIDEMFFTMRVSVKEMLPIWGPQSNTITDSYILFTKLRKMGIRMHSWP